MRAVGDIESSLGAMIIILVERSGLYKALNKTSRYCLKNLPRRQTSSKDTSQNLYPVRRS
ncbi:MAG: hypothetical protein AB7V56_02040 [Candidatus Nitrosocosmicus sp.]|uniref:hypothetical protein n=1 Tax=Candidatus Nitrosocosmicus agrestis TaxID=2563600 RepID=UPI00122E530E|nr:hypothetical protein [Candidatus Nitrosocosmicus sp. SS]KAA2281940.1 hypothetical protein F1Z66_07210 [Candidatus Nitrosocosmicus sp. SS]KAF0869845.1 hypothetical protein E5N71_02485 [Candidatus Nitrosocosmicus sp. SS]MDR4490635.1 hypothetical protein [Candidatus Nitrosocosmicus sp.]HET6589910.1 hypothetical protein [Candidatus Nitrosocosmicus sp.]